MSGSANWDFLTCDNLRQQFRQKWTEQLYKEHSNICYQYGVSLKTPLIKIENYKNLWGQWNSEAICISIASRLIEDFPWDTAIEILKHEMAHPIVSEKFYNNEDIHGSRFKEACRMLGVADWAVKASVELEKPISNWKDEVDKDPNDKLLSKVEKLLALASSDNEHEAALAMQRVLEICTKYNLDRISSGEKADHVYLIIDRKKKRSALYESKICSLLTNYYFVKVIFSSRFDAQSCEEYRVLELLGTKKNVLMAEHVYHFLFRSLHSLWNSYQLKTGIEGKSKLSYMLGVLEGFESKLKTSMESIIKVADDKIFLTKNEGKLIVVKDIQLDSFVKSRFPRLVNRHRGRRYHDANSFNAGNHDGKRLTISKVVTRANGAETRLLR